jgi:hypothetical protein
MNQISAQDVAANWIDKWQSENPVSDLAHPEYDLDWKIPRENPQLCLDSILEILARIPADPSNRHFQVLAAGPLEDLLVNHGIDYVEKVELLARREPAFRLLLNGAWTSSIEPEVVARLSKFMAESW